MSSQGAAVLACSYTRWSLSIFLSLHPQFVSGGGAKVANLTAGNGDGPSGLLSPFEGCFSSFVDSHKHPIPTQSLGGQYLVPPPEDGAVCPSSGHPVNLS